MNRESMTGEQLRAAVHDLIGRELGPAALIQFLRESNAGSGDYTRDRHQWLPDWNVAEWAAAIERRRTELKSPPTAT